MTVPEATAPAAQDTTDAPLPVLRVLAATTAVGLGLGFLVGGVGSRLAMRALFLTTEPSARGIMSDDGFMIGRVTMSGTLNLLLLGTLVGVVGAFVYLAARPFLVGPTWLRRLTCALGGGAVLGSMLVHVEGVDFTRLGPTWFAIALFVVLPAVYAYAAALAVERAIRPGGWFATAPLWFALLPLVVFVFPPLLVLIGVPVLVVVGARRWLQRSPLAAGLARHPVTMWVVRAGWLAVAVGGLVTLARDARLLL